MSQPFRIPGHGLAGGPLRFTFDGVAYHGMEGDTIASALLANGVHLMGRSFKYHRPRGVLGPVWRNPMPWSASRAAPAGSIRTGWQRPNCWPMV